jgi:hypothetical protein
MSWCRVFEIPFYKPLRIRLWWWDKDGKIELRKRSVSEGEYGRVM